MADSGNDHSLPSWDQVVALAVTYKRLLFNLMFVPAITVAIPIALTLAYPIFDRITNNYTLLTFSLTFLGTYWVQSSIHQYAPNEKSAVEALETTGIRLPLILFALVAAAANAIFTPIGDMLGIKEFLMWSPSISISCALRIAAGAFVLGLTVVLRYAGPHSVVRCSSSPLIAHPVVTKLRTLWSKLSVDAVFDFFVGPSEMAGDLYKTPLEYRENARRLQCPTLGDAIAQIVISGFGALAFAYISVIPFFAPFGDNSHKTLLMLSSVFAVWNSLFRDALDGSSHEINPIRYHPSLLLKRRDLLLRFTAVCKSLVTAVIFVPTIAIFASCFFSNYQFESGNEMFWTMAAACVLTAVLATLYLHVFDEVLRTLLCTPIDNFQKLVEGIAEDDRPEILLDVAMHSILHSDPSLVNDLSKIVKPFLRDLERKELERNESAMKTMANILLQKSAGDESSARFEEDLLRFHVLESLGGSSFKGISYEGFEKAEAYHVENLKRWIQPQDKLKIGQMRSEPLVVPLVRSLCAYVGGLGEALSICSGQKMVANLNPWILPPGAILCAEYALRAASRCILFNLSHSAQILSDWRSTHLSMFIPVLIASACRLEMGMLMFIQAQNGIKHISMDKFDIVRTESPELLSLFYECNNTVFTIIRKLKSLEGVRRIDFDLDPVCRKWMESVMQKSL